MVGNQFLSAMCNCSAWHSYQESPGTFLSRLTGAVRSILEKRGETIAEPLCFGSGQGAFGGWNAPGKARLDACREKVAPWVVHEHPAICCHGPWLTLGSCRMLSKATLESYQAATRVVSLASTIAPRLRSRESYSTKPMG